MYSSPTRPNMPPRAPNTNFPPPPPRPPPPSATKPTYPTTPATGANRYPRYAKTEGAKGTSARDEAQIRAKAFRAWEQMNHAQMPKTRPVPPFPTKPPKESPFQSGREASNNMPKEASPRMRPGWEQFRETNAGSPNLSRANTARSPRKPGFAPGTAGGDEPPARDASAYFNVMKGGRANVAGAAPAFESPLGGSPHTMRKPDPLGRFRAQSGTEDLLRGDRDRISTPYATTGGERTYFSSSGLGRSASTREPQNGKEWNGPRSSNYRTPGSQANSGRHHSASPQMRGAANRYRSPSISSTSSDDSIQMGNEKDFNASTRKSNGERRSAAPDAHDRYHGNQRYQPFVQANSDELKGTANMRPDFTADPSNPTRNAWSQRKEASGYASSNGYTSNTDAHLQPPKEREAYYIWQHQPQPAADHPTGASAPYIEDPQRPLRSSESWQERYKPKATVNDSGTGEKAGKSTMYDNPGLSPFFLHSSQRKSNAWPFMSQDETQSSTPYWAIPSSVWPQRPSAVRVESLHPTQWKRKALYPAVDRANKISNNSFTFPTQNQPSCELPPHSTNPKSHSSENINTTFSPTEWTGKFTGNATEYFAPTSASSDRATRAKVSPTRGPQSSRPPLQEQYNQPSTNDQGSGHGDKPQVPPTKAPENPLSSGKAQFSSEEWNEIFKEQTWSFQPPPPPLSPNRQSGFKRPKTPRKQSTGVKKRAAGSKPASIRATVDDSGDDGVDNDTVSNGESSGSHTSVEGNAMDIDTSFTAPSNGLPPVAHAPDPNRTETTSRQPPGHVPGYSVPLDSSGPKVAGQDVSDLNLGNLKKVAPFVSGEDGLKDLGDLSSTLPFESRPAASTSSLAPRRLELPNPPKAPEVPEKLTQNAWERYVALMSAYMFEWNGYNRKMLGHFNDRQRDVEEGLLPKWMSAIGEGGGDKGGYGKLMQGVEEDFRVRAHWDVSWEKHRECLRGLGQVREKLLKTATVV